MKKPNQETRSNLIIVSAVLLVVGLFYVALKGNPFASSSDRLLSKLEGLDQQQTNQMRIKCLKENNFYCLTVVYEKLLTFEPHNSLYKANLAINLTRTGQHQQAVPIYQSLIESGENTYDLMGFYGNSLAALGKSEEAIEQYKNALSISPNLRDITKSLAVQLTKAGRPQEALSLLKSFTEKFPGSKSYFHGNIIALSEKSLEGDSSQENKESTQIKLIAVDGSHHYLSLKGTSNKAEAFLVDTGASITSMSSKQFQSLFPNHSGSTKSEKFRTADGKIINAQVTTVPTIKVGQWILKDVEVGHCDTCSALAGKSLLKNFSMETKPQGKVEYLTLKR